MALPFLLLGNFLRSGRERGSSEGELGSADLDRRHRSPSLDQVDHLPRESHHPPEWIASTDKEKWREIDPHGSVADELPEKEPSASSSSPRRPSSQLKPRPSPLLSHDDTAAHPPDRIRLETDGLPRTLTWDPMLASSGFANSGPSVTSSSSKDGNHPSPLPTLTSRLHRPRRRPTHIFTPSAPSSLQGLARWLFAKDSRAASSTDEAGERGSVAETVEPKYRWTPILSGLIVPFSILLEIPGLTEHWYVQSASLKNSAIPNLYRANPILLDVGLAISMALALLANLALIFRFLDRRVARWTLVAIISLAIHDAINVTAIIVFGVVHRFNDGYVYAEAYWMTVGSTAASLFVNVSLTLDWYRTEDFRRSGSGLTTKQRKLVITVMILLAYIALGALVYSLILSLSFQDGLYFTIISIETIGFGDIVPFTIGSKIFCFFYQALGIVNLAFTVTLAQETLMESWATAYRRRRSTLRLKRTSRRTALAQSSSRQHLVEERLQRMGVPVWVPARAPLGRGGANQTRRMTLNLAALDGQVGLDGEMREEVERLRGLDPRQMESNAAVREKQGKQNEEEESYEELKRRLEEEERKEWWYKLSFAWGLFVIFWLIGATVFSKIEGWNFFVSLYFCYIAFSTIGYGDYSPRTPFGRAFFIIWSLFGVAAMTILFSVIGDAYSSQYKKGALKDQTSKTVHMMRTRRMSTLSSPSSHTFSRTDTDTSLLSPTSPTFPSAPPSNSFTAPVSTPLGGPASPTSDSSHDPRGSLLALTDTLLAQATLFRSHATYLLTHPTSTHPFETLPLSLRQTLEARADRETGGGDEHAKRELLEDEDGRRELLVGGFEEEWEGLRRVGEEIRRVLTDGGGEGRVLEEDEQRSDSPVQMEVGTDG